MALGCFSVSLAVKDLATSKKFYEALGFAEFHGDAAQGWLILKNGDTAIGLFQGMFEKNILTFNPGWNQNAQQVDEFTDVRAIQKSLVKNGFNTVTEVEKDSQGPGNFIVEDPDGNQIMFDQHV